MTTLDQAEARTRYGAMAALFACVTLMALTLTWTYLGMRSVMDIGGTCAQGGPYEIAQPCPNGSWMIAVAIPVLVVVSMAGSAVATSLSAPGLLMPMWGLLFGSLGWNFLDYGAFSGDIVWGWLVCGVIFELMALPVVFLVLPSRQGSRWRPPTATAPVSNHTAWWWAAYAGFAMIGLGLGTVSFTAWS